MAFLCLINWGYQLLRNWDDAPSKGPFVACISDPPKDMLPKTRLTALDLTGNSDLAVFYGCSDEQSLGWCISVDPSPPYNKESSPFPTFFFAGAFAVGFEGVSMGGKKSSQRAIRSFPMTSLTGTRASLKDVQMFFRSLPWYITIWLEEDFGLLPEQWQVIMYTVYCTVIPY